MGAGTFTQSAFYGGEWTPFMQGRYDRPDYKFAMTTCLNQFPIEEGAVTRRPGFKFGGTTRNGLAGRLLTWTFQSSLPYTIELTNAIFRFWSATSGVHTLVTTNDAQTVTNVSTATPAVVTTAGAHGWSTGDQVFLTFGAGVASPVLAQLQNRQLQITVTNTTTFTISDPTTGNPISGAGLGWVAASAVKAHRVLQIANAYVAGTGTDWKVGNLRMVQAGARAFFLQNATAPQVLTLTGSPSANLDATFSFGAASFIDGPYLDYDGSNVTPGETSGSVTLDFSGASHSFVNGDIGRHIRILSMPPAWAVGTSYTAGQNVMYNNLCYVCTTNNMGVIPITSVSDWQVNTAGVVWSWGIITAVNNTTEVVISLQGPPLLYTSVSTNWQLGLFGGTNGYPTCGVFAGGRLWFGGVVANRFDASMSNNIFQFSPTAFDSGTVGAANAISYTVNSNDTDSFQWMMAMSQGIVMGTPGGEWLVPVVTGGWTPTNIDANKVTTYGSSPVDPVLTQLTSVFVQRYTYKLLEYFPDVFSGRYSAPNLTLTGKHLTTQNGGIAELAYQKELSPIVWARMANNALIGCTYKRENLFSSQGPTFAGWHRHILGGSAAVLSVATAASPPPANTDTLGLITQLGSGPCHVQFLSDFFDVADVIEDAIFVDEAVGPSMHGAIGASITSSGQNGSVTINGLWHLNGQTVSIFAAGVDAGDYEVVNGSVIVPLGASSDSLFTLELLQSFRNLSASWGSFLTTQVDDGLGNVLYVMPLVVGLTYPTQGQLLRPDFPAAEAGAQGPGAALGKTRCIHMYGAQVQNTQGVSFGTDLNAPPNSTLHAANFVSPGGTPLAANDLFTGVHWDTLEADSDFDNTFCWQVTRPYPCTITALNLFLHTQDR